VVDVFECKVNPDNFDPEALKAFRAQYPKGQNFVTGPWADVPYARRYGDLAVTFGTPADLLSPVRSPRRRPSSGPGRTGRTVKRS
jgi:hypothetical protein